MEKIVQVMEELVVKGDSFVLATVISRNGSAPRSAGAKMLVKKDGSIVGTVGGGILEAQVQQLAAQMNEKHQAIIQSFSFSGKDASTMDAICGGQVEVLVEWMDGKDGPTVNLIHKLFETLSAHRKVWLITTLPVKTTFTHHALYFQDSAILGNLPQTVTFEKVAGTRTLDFIKNDTDQIVIEPVNVVGTAYIFGAGHVSRSLAEFVKAVGFWTVVVDDRAEFCNRERFPEADELIVPDSYTDIMQKISVDQNSFIVIVTRGHLNDRAVLAQALKTDAGYIGMIGSKRKCNLIYQELYNVGFTEKDIQRVHAPIGIPIQAETPEEIGVSITAEMIQVRAQLQK
jgi:xanthine dehydrogenase accessory factor